MATSYLKMRVKPTHKTLFISNTPQIMVTLNQLLSQTFRESKLAVNI